MKHKAVHNGREVLVEVLKIAKDKFDEIEAEGSAGIPYEIGYVRGRLEVAQEALGIYDEMLRNLSYEDEYRGEP